MGSSTKDPTTEVTADALMQNVGVVTITPMGDATMRRMVEDHLNDPGVQRRASFLDAAVDNDDVAEAIGNELGVAGRDVSMAHLERAERRGQIGRLYADCPCTRPRRESMRPKATRRGAGRPAGSKVKGSSQRASARSGDSGEGSEQADDPEPSFEPPARRLCICGCGDAVDGKAKYANAACRKRASRSRAAERDKVLANREGWSTIRVVWVPVSNPVVAEVLRRAGELAGTLEHEPSARDRRGERAWHPTL